MMVAARRLVNSTLAWVAALAACPAQADTTTYEVVNGVQCQVTRRTTQVPMTQVSNQQQTVYRQQLTTQTLQQQQLYTVPVTQYQLVSRLHGRWNPFVTPYWTHQYEPVTIWQQQTATVQIPVSTMAWTPETRSVQVPTTTMVPVEAIVSIQALPAGAGSQQLMASAGGASSTAAATTTGPTAMLAARPSSISSAPPAAASVPVLASAPINYGGHAIDKDPPPQPSGWQSASPDRYNDSLRR